VGVEKMETPHEIRGLNTLAFPKGKHPKCELTNVPATVQCETPYITLYYATREVDLFLVFWNKREFDSN
jgi:hypothetical protein